MSIKTSIAETAALARSNAVIGSDNILSSRTTGGTILTQSTSLKTLQNQNLPTLWSLKVAPGKRFIHIQEKDSNTMEYPGLYVYLGLNIQEAMSSINVGSPYLPEGCHPYMFVYGHPKTIKQTGVRTYLRKKDGTKGDLYDNSLLTQKGITNAFTYFAFDPEDDKKPQKSLDGWYELPVSAAEAFPMYACVFMGPGQIPTFALLTVDVDLKQVAVTNPNSLQNIQQWVNIPNLDVFYTMATTSGDSFNGMVGTPKLMYDKNVYSDKIGGYFADASDDVKILASENKGSMDFIDPYDTMQPCFRPVLVGLEEGSTVESPIRWNYGFSLEMQPSVWKMPQTYNGNTNSEYTDEKKMYIIEATADEGTVYVCQFISTEGTQSYFALLDPTGEMKSAIQPACQIGWRTDKAVAYDHRGEVITLFVMPDYTDDHLKGCTDSSMIRLALIPMYLDNTDNNKNAGVNGLACYVPQVRLEMEPIPSSPDTSKTLPIHGIIQACRILGGASYQVNFTQTEGYKLGPMVNAQGETLFRKYGQSCPRYITSQLNMTTVVSGDSFRFCQPNQYMESTAYDSRMGHYKGQNGSIDSIKFTQTVTGEDDAKCSMDMQFYQLHNFYDCEPKPFSDLYEESSDDDNPGEMVLKAPTQLVLRVGNTEEGEASFLGEEGDGAHIEYVDLDTLPYLKDDDPYNPYVKEDDLPDYIPDITDDLYWKKGGDHNDNYGTSFKLGSGNNWITVSYEQ